MFSTFSLIRSDETHVQNPTHIVIVDKCDDRSCWYLYYHRSRFFEIYRGQSVRRVYVGCGKLLYWSCGHDMALIKLPEDILDLIEISLESDGDDRSAGR